MVTKHPMHKCLHLADTPSAAIPSLQDTDDWPFSNRLQLGPSLLVRLHGHHSILGPRPILLHHCTIRMGSPAILIFFLIKDPHACIVTFLHLLIGLLTIRSASAAGAEPQTLMNDLAELHSSAQLLLCYKFRVTSCIFFRLTGSLLLWRRRPWSISIICDHIAKYGPLDERSDVR